MSVSGPRSNQQGEYKRVLDCFAADMDDEAATPIIVVRRGEVAAWLQAQPAMTQAWLQNTGFRSKPGQIGLWTIFIGN